MGNKINAVKHLREKYDIMQKLLICKGISRPYLSNLENGKVELSHEMAYRIAEKFNEVFAEKGIDLRLDKEDLMNGRRLINKLELSDELARCEQIKNIDFEEVRMLEERYLVVESPYEYARLNSLLGNVYYNRNEKAKAVRYLGKAFDAYVSKESIREAIPILTRLTHSYVELNDLKTAKAYDDYFFTELCNQFDDFDDRILDKMFYNSALLNKRLGNYKLALKRLDKYDDLVFGRKQRKEFSRVLRSNIYLAQFELEKGEQILVELLETTTDETVRIYSSVTLLEFYLAQKRTDEFHKLIRSIVFFMKDARDALREYSFFWMTLIVLAHQMGDKEFVFDNMKFASQIIESNGKRSELKGIINVISEYVGISDTAKALKADLMEAYLKM